MSDIEIERAQQERDTADALVKELVSRVTSLQNEKKSLTARCTALRIQLKLRADERIAKEEAKARVKAADARLELAGVVVAEQNCDWIV